MTFLNPLDALIPKFPFVAEFWVWVTAWGPEVSLDRILGGPSTEPAHPISRHKRTVNHPLELAGLPAERIYLLFHLGLDLSTSWWAFAAEPRDVPVGTGGGWKRGQWTVCPQQEAVGDTKCLSIFPHSSS